MGRIEEALRKAKANRHVPRVDVPLLDEPVDTEAETIVELKRSARDHSITTIVGSHLGPVDSDYLFEQRVIAASDQDDRVGPYRQLRTLMLKTMTDNGWTTLAITSPNEGAGKTLTAANLAISISRAADVSALLVDLDLVTPSIHEKLNFNPEKGLVDYLDDNAELEEILFNPGLDRLTVLAGRSARKNSSELLASPKMRTLIRELCQQDVASFTIFDLPPLLRNDDAVLFAPYADATLIVVEDGVTTVDQLEEGMRLLEQANVIGTVLNKAKV